MKNPLPTKRAVRRYIRLVVPSCCMSKVSRGIKGQTGNICTHARMVKVVSEVDIW